MAYRSGCLVCGKSRRRGNPYCSAVCRKEDDVLRGLGLAVVLFGAVTDPELPGQIRKLGNLFTETLKAATGEAE